MSDAFLSKSGNDGTATLDDPLLPYLTMSAAEVDVVDGDDIVLFNGVYDGDDIECNGGIGYALIDKGITIRAENIGGATVSPGIATAAFRFNGQFNGKTCGVEGINFDNSDTQANYYIWIRNQNATKGILNIKNNTFADPAFHCIYESNASAMDINTESNTATMVDGQSFANLEGMTGGDIRSLNDTCNTSAKDNSAPLFAIGKASGSMTAEVKGFNSSMTINSTALSQFRCIEIINIDDAVIESCNLSADLTAGSNTNPTAALAVIDCESGALTAHRGLIRNNTLTNKSNGGFCALIGHDVTTAGDDLCNNGNIFNNTITGNATFKAGGGHGYMFGFCTGGQSSFNKATNIALGLLCKMATGGGHFSNKISKYGIPSSTNGSAIQSKGCTNTKYYGNEITIDADCYGASFVANAEGATNNSGVEVNSNALIVSQTPTANASLMSVLASQVVSFSANNYLNTDLMTNNATPMNNQGSTISIAAWKAAVETNANIDDDTTRLVTSGAGGNNAIKQPMGI